VAGAGAVGSAVAVGLAREGWRVTVCDVAPQGPNASSVAAGMLAPAFEALFDALSADRYPLFRAARDLWGDWDAPVSRAGALAVGERAEVEAWAARLAEIGAQGEVLPPARATIAAQGRVTERWGVLTPEDWRLEPQPVLGRLQDLGRALGVRFVDRAVAEFASSRAVLQGGGRLAADLLVIATGAGRSLVHVAPELRALMPVKGHILRAPTAGPPGPVIRTPGLYLARGEHEQILGATMEPGRDDTEIDPAAVAALIRRAEALSPDLARAPWRAAAGVRGATPDGLPLVGRSTADRVILAVGARRNGWLLAPLIAAEVVRAAGERAPGPWTALLAPGRDDSALRTTG